MNHSYQDELNRAERDHEIWRIGFEVNHKKLRAELVAKHGEEYVIELEREALENEKH